MNSTARGIAACALLISSSALSDSEAVSFTHSTSVSTTRAEQSSDAFKWGLSESEYRDYQRLMRSKRGVWSPGLDPITALGVTTDNAFERRRLAELYVKTEFERTRKELAFQVEVDKAWKRLYPATPVVQPGLAPSNQSSVVSRYAVVVGLDCSECDTLLAERFSQLVDESASGVDIHVVGTGFDDKVLRAWVSRHSSIGAALRGGKATINHGDQLTNPPQLPMVYRKSGEASTWQRDY